MFDRTVISKFRASNGQYLLRGLFLEKTNNKDTAVYTMKPEDHSGYPSFSRLYLSLSDPTEYLPAVELTEGIDHWNKLLECTWFQTYITKLRYELDLRMKSQALLAIQKEAESGGRNAFSANKILLEYNKAQTKGRPTNAEIFKEAKKQASELSRINTDYDRLVNGQ